MPHKRREKPNHLSVFTAFFSKFGFSPNIFDKSMPVCDIVWKMIADLMLTKHEAKNEVDCFSWYLLLVLIVLLLVLIQDCRLQLTDEPDKRCYPLDDLLLCQTCHLRRLNRNP